MNKPTAIAPESRIEARRSPRGSGWNRLRSRLVPMLCGVMAMLLAPAGALAQRSRGPERDLGDARIEGYGRVLQLEGSTGLTWVLLVFLMVICLAVLFKDARRSRLD